MGAWSPRPGALQPLTWSEFCGGPAAVSLFLFWTEARTRGEGERARGGKEDEWIKEKKNNPSLRMGLEPGPAPGHLWGRSEQLRAAGRPGGYWAGPAEGSLASGLREPALARSAGSGELGAGFTDGGRVRGADWAAAGARPGEAPREPDSRAALHCCSRGKGEQISFRSREAAPWSLSRRVPGEAVMAAPWEQGAGWCGGEASLHGVMMCFLERLASQQSPASILLR